jgi:outer membrane protein TolC
MPSSKASPIRARCVPGVDVSWEIDLAGGVRAARDAAHADAVAAAAGADGARLLVASEVARQYFICAVRKSNFASCRPLADAQRETAARVASRQREGQASAFDLDRARAEADAFDAQVPPLRTLAGVRKRI